jgi:hypothetical protein
MRPKGIIESKVTMLLNGISIKETSHVANHINAELAV